MPSPSLLKRGIGRAGHAEIAERANVSVATVFNYFRTREELVDAVLSEVESYLYTMARQSHDSGNSALACIEQFIDCYVDAAYEKGDYNLIALEWGASIRDDVWPRFTLFCERMLEITTRTLLRGEQAGEFKLHMDTQSLAQLLNSFCFPASPDDLQDTTTTQRTGQRVYVARQPTGSGDPLIPDLSCVTTPEPVIWPILAGFPP